MNDLEQRLQSMRLAAPSADLDRRLDDAFRAAGRAGQRSRKPVFWWSFAAATAAVATAAAVLLMWPRRPEPVPRQVVYRVEAQGRLRQLLLDPAGRRDERPNWVAQVVAAK